MGSHTAGISLSTCVVHAAPLPFSGGRSASGCVLLLVPEFALAAALLCAVVPQLDQRLQPALGTHDALMQAVAEVLAARSGDAQLVTVVLDLAAALCGQRQDALPDGRPVGLLRFLWLRRTGRNPVTVTL